MKTTGLETITEETQVKFYSVTNNGNKKDLLAIWTMQDDEQLINCTIGMCAGLWQRYKRGRVECYKTDGNGCETLIHECRFRR